MANSDAVKRLGDASRSAFKTPPKAPEAKSFDEAREGALSQMGNRGLPANEAAPKAPKMKPREKDEGDRLQEASDQGGGLSLDDAKAALSRRKKAKPEVYRAVE